MCVCLCTVRVCVRLFICLFCYIMFARGTVAEEGEGRKGCYGSQARTASRKTKVKKFKNQMLQTC